MSEPATDAEARVEYAVPVGHHDNTVSVRCIIRADDGDPTWCDGDSSPELGHGRRGHDDARHTERRVGLRAGCVRSRRHQSKGERDEKDEP